MPAHPSVLVVEDDPDNRELLVDYLTLAGFAVVSASCGDEALQITDLFRPDAIVMNVHLGEGPDGLEVTRRLRASPQTSDIAIMATSSRCQVTDEQAALSAGCDEFWRKPFDLDRLESRLRALIRPKRV